VAGRLLGSQGCKYCSRGVWLGLYCIHILVVWVEFVKDLLVNVCYGTAKSSEIISRDMWVSTGQNADCAGGEFPFIYLFGCVEGVFSGGLFSTQPSHLLFIHAFTGCDTTSRIFGIEKKSLFQKFVKGDKDLESCAPCFTNPDAIEQNGYKAKVLLFSGKPTAT